METDAAIPPEQHSWALSNFGVPCLEDAAVRAHRRNRVSEFPHNTPLTKLFLAYRQPASLVCNKPCRRMEIRFLYATSRPCPLCDWRAKTHHTHPQKTTPSITGCGVTAKDPHSSGHTTGGEENEAIKTQTFTCRTTFHFISCFNSAYSNKG